MAHSVKIYFQAGQDKHLVFDCLCPVNDYFTWCYVLHYFKIDE